MSPFSVRLWPWVAATLSIAVMVHLATVIPLPHLIMGRLLAQLVRNGGYNTLRHGARPNANSRGVVRPSPDLLYSTCPYDLSSGPLLLEARVPRDTYWSVSLFDADTNNYYARNDRQAPDGEVRMLLARRDAGATPTLPGATMVRSPTLRGLVLFRTLINDETKIGEIDSQRREASCRTWRPAPVQG